MIRTRSALFALTSAAYMLPVLCLAEWDFVPSAAEWATWPVYCKVQYSSVSAEVAENLGGAYPQSVIDEWRSQIGSRTFLGLHHWCASMHFLSRGKLETDPQQRSFLLHRALADARYSFVRSEKQSTVYPNIAVTIAQIEAELGQRDQALDALARAIEAQPTRTEPYLMKALLERRSGDLRGALQTLLTADRVTDGDSAEVQYDLGLIHLELGDVDAAVVSAKKAYALGYPLPGLKRRLIKEGRWSD